MELPEEKRAVLIENIQVRRERSRINYVKRPTIEDGITPFDKWYLLPDDESNIKVDEKFKKNIQILSDPEECENQYYGFLWNHPLKKSPDYEGNRTFETFKEKGNPVDYVEVLIKSATKQTSKKNNSYWLLKTEDVNGEDGFIQVWQDEWDRFGPELKAGEFVKLKVKAPDNGFYRYTLYSPKKWPRWEYEKLIPKERKFDLRVVVLRK
jgi:hypothetical protein